MENRRVTRSLAEGVERWIEKTNIRLSLHGGLLIHQRYETRPQWRRCAGAADYRLLAIVCHNPNDIIGDTGDIGNIALGRGPMVCGEVNTLLPGWNRVSSAEPSAAPGPCRLRQPRAARTARSQGCPAYHRDVGIVGGRGD